MAYIRRKNTHYQETIVVPHQHGTLSTNATRAFFSVGSKMRVRRVIYACYAGIVQSATDYVTIRLMNGAEVVASWSTQDSADGTIAPNEPVYLNLNADTTKLVYDVNADMVFDLVVAGTGSAPDSQLTVEGLYL